MKSKIYQRPAARFTIFLDNKPTTEEGVKLVDIKLPSDWMTAAATGRVSKDHWMFSTAGGGFGVVKPSDRTMEHAQLQAGEVVMPKGSLAHAHLVAMEQALSSGKLSTAELIITSGRRTGRTDALRRLTQSMTNLGQRVIDATEGLIASYFNSFQKRVRAWVDAIGFKMGDKQVRLRRFAEEAAELCQAGGLSYEDFAFVTLDAYRRPVGEVGQEIGGVSMTLFALAEAHGFSVGDEAMRELKRVEHPEMIEKIRAKQIEKEARGV
ncbi:hypothetical protein CPT_Seuss56 [Caulobacter phage Seuss]|uniref:Uncharacterized protein n=1 Tax=Caulobacter phage Seuss TaxID=1675601 RepID=A0A0K1LM37_9CAUD|nr:hypothetical protein HOR08_gp056 [Caulobacter phage Seuss]AKU43582.1 hypothetical protein CPT_Seuss56 [Caulobacter phage Seuss]